MSEKIQRAMRRITSKSTKLSTKIINTNLLLLETKDDLGNSETLKYLAGQLDKCDLDFVTEKHLSELTPIDLVTINEFIYYSEYYCELTRKMYGLK